LKKLAVAALVLVCAGCRSDGGVGRFDQKRGMEFSTSRVADRTGYDMHRTWYLITSAPGYVANSFTQGFDRMEDTYHLYFDATSTENHRAH
jgi:hypothetical protein